MSKLLTTTIVASKWACGGRKTQLVNKDGTMCCLGFDAIQRGVPRELLLEEAATLPSDFDFSEYGEKTATYAADWVVDDATDIIEALDERARKIVYDASEDVTALEDLAVRINDSKRRMTKRERVELLRPVFKAAGRRIRFIDDEHRSSK